MLVPVSQEHHGFDSSLDHERVELTLDAVCRVYVAGGAVFPCRHNDRDVLLAGSEHPAVLRVDFVILFEDTASEKPVDDLVWKKPFSFCLHVFPDFHEVVFETAECLFFRDTCIGHPVHVVVQKFFLLLRGEITVVRNPVVVVVSHQVHDILFKVVCRARNDVNLVLTDHFRQGKSEFCRTHGACHGQHHLSTLVDVFVVSLCSIYESCGVEMTIMVCNEL